MLKYEIFLPLFCSPGQVTKWLCVSSFQDFFNQWLCSQAEGERGGRVWFFWLWQQHLSETGISFIKTRKTEVHICVVCKDQWIFHTCQTVLVFCHTLTMLIKECRGVTLSSSGGPGWIYHRGWFLPALFCSFLFSIRTGRKQHRPLQFPGVRFSALSTVSPAALVLSSASGSLYPSLHTFKSGLCLSKTLSLSKYPFPCVWEHFPRATECCSLLHLNMHTQQLGRVMRLKRKTKKRNPT